VSAKKYDREYEEIPEIKVIESEDHKSSTPISLNICDAILLNPNFIPAKDLE
jgi:hypothetical protein